MQTVTTIGLDIAKSKARTIARPPGWRLNRVAKAIYSKKTYERVFQPTLRSARLFSEFPISGWSGPSALSQPA
jgi:hypothetical protein